MTPGKGGKGLCPPSPALLRSALALVVCLTLTGAAQGGHELPFYPSYYPQEIRVETLAPAAAAPRLAKGALHAYVGSDPFAGRTVPANVTPLESLGGYLMLTFNPASPAGGTREGRCAGARRVVGMLAPGGAAYVFHPYAVTPYHADYLEHFDLAQAQKKDFEARAPAAGAVPLRVRAQGALAQRLLRAPAGAQGKDWDASLEEVDLAGLAAAQATTPDGWPGPPWIKEGWFHAYLLQAGALTDGAARQAVEGLHRRLVTGAYGDLAERVELERRLVSRLGSGCERVVLGYAPRREYYNSEFSAGVENIARDSQAGFNAPIFLRTVKLKDFPWNGWLRLGIASRPAAAWNPVGGFGDPAGRLLWAALGDPAMIPGPYGGDWVANRMAAAAVTRAAGSGVELPEDALAPEPGTGLLREVGKGKTARARILYRVAASAFHDNTRMTPADAVYPFIFAERWSARRPPGGGEYDPAVEAASSLARQALVGFKVLGVDTEVKKYGDITFTYTVPVIEVYVGSASPDPQRLALMAPPWSAVPWHVMALMEEAVKRGWGAFSPAEARRRGVRELDLARDQKLKDALASLVDGFAAQGWVPAALKRLVTADEAQTRWSALKRFYQRRGHFLVTSGPYQLEKWSDRAVVLQVFRDFSYPLGVGSFDRYAMPRRAFVSRMTPRGDRLEISAEVERVERFLREYRLVREPLAAPSSADERQDVPRCRYVVVSADGEVAAAGASGEAQSGRLIVSLKGKVKPGLYTVMVALSLGENQVNPEIATAQYRVDSTP